MRLLIKNGTIVTATDEFKSDIFAVDGTIVAIGKDLDFNADRIVDAKDKYILPGGVDQHVHFSFDFKGEKVRGFETSNAAIVGGTTTVIEFVNQVKGKGMIESIKAYNENEVIGTAMADYSFHGVVTDPTEELFEEIRLLPKEGISTIKLFMAYKGMPFHSDDSIIFRALQLSRSAGVTIMVHAENADVIDVLQKQLVAKGKTAPYYHAVSRPPLVEEEATKRAIYLASLAESPLYVVHVSCKGAMEAIREASAKGLPIYGETCSHYLTLDTELLAKPDFEGAKYVCSPALRSKDHHEALWQGLRNKWLNAVSSDHCGFDWKKQKHMGINSFTDIPNGAPGMENRLAILWTYGVERGRISKKQLVDLYATTPAKINGIGHRKGHIGIGYDADLVIFNTHWKGTISNKISLHNVDYSPYEGMEQIGRPEQVYLRGELVANNGQYVGKKGQGEFIKGKPFGLCYE